MARMQWGAPVDKLFEVGVDRGVLNVHGTRTKCVPWDGLVEVNEKTPTADPEVTYLDSVKIYNSIPPSDYAATISALYSPPEFDPCDGVEDLGDGLFVTENRPEKFNMSFRSMVGPRNYKIHLIYNALATPADRTYKTLTGSVDLDPIDWDITTQPVMYQDVPYQAHYYLDTSKTNPALVWAVENLIYGTPTTNPLFPPYQQLRDLRNNLATIDVTDHNDGTWTIEADNSIAYMIDTVEQLFGVDWSGVQLMRRNVFTVSDSNTPNGGGSRG